MRRPESLTPGPPFPAPGGLLASVLSPFPRSDGRGAFRFAIQSVALASGSVAWGAYSGRLLLRSLHMLQLEGYETRRFLRWSTAKPGRWAGADRAALAMAAAVLGARGARLGGPVGVLGTAAWAGLGAWLWRGAQPEPAKKPLVLTQRARRLLAGEALIGLAIAGGPAGVALARGGGLRQAVPLLCVGAGGLSLLAPLVAAGANLLLWPVEEAFRRYYLADARRLLGAYRPTVVGVAGSYGKTSTKEFLGTILGRRWQVLKPPGSYNTPMGLSRVIREQLRPAHNLFVAELGDYVPGDIRFLCDLLGPRIGVLTAIGPEHLERFGTIERVAQAKAELLDALPTDGVAVVNQDDPRVRTLGDRAEARGLRVVRYGYMGVGSWELGAGGRVGASPTPSSQLPTPTTVWARDVRTTREGLRFAVVAEGHGEASFQIGVLGRHNVGNVLAATAVALELGMSLDEVARAARGIEPVEHRLQPIRGEGGVLVIDDAFNSNPRGAAEALRVLGELDARRRVLVTPGMIELAEQEWDENLAFGRRAAEVCDDVILVGPERARPILAGLREAGYPESHTHVVRNLAEATARLGGLIGAGDVVLFENDLPDTYEDAGKDTGEDAGPTTEDRPRTTDGRRRADARRQSREDGRPATDHGAPTPGEQQDRSSALGLPSVVLGPSSVVSVDGLRIAYRERGAASERRPVVVLHGWGASSAAVASIQDCLAADHRTIAPDVPGFGASDPPPRAWGLDEYVRAIRAFLAQLGIERAHLIGHSRGGAFAIALAATTPSLVERLVLVDSAGIRPRRGPSYRARVLAYKAARRVVATPPLRGHQGVQDWFARRFGSEDYRQAGSLRETLVRLVNEDVRHLLPRVTAPTLLIWGELDDATPLADGQLMERAIQDAGLVVFPGAGHFSYADDPGRFCRVVGHFLEA